MDLYGILYPDTHLQTPNSGPPKHKILGLGFRVWGISVKLFLSVLISATGIFPPSILKSLVTHLGTPT